MSDHQQCDRAAGCGSVAVATEYEVEHDGTTCCLEAESLQEAVELWRALPGGRDGTVRVRPSSSWHVFEVGMVPQAVEIAEPAPAAKRANEEEVSA